MVVAVVEVVLIREVVVVVVVTDVVVVVSDVVVVVADVVVVVLEVVADVDVVDVTHVAEDVITVSVTQYCADCTRSLYQWKKISHGYCVSQGLLGICNSAKLMGSSLICLRCPAEEHIHHTRIIG